MQNNRKRPKKKRKRPGYYIQSTCMRASDVPPVAMTEYVPVSSLEASSITKKCFVPSHLTRYLERTPVGTSTPFFILKEEEAFEISHIHTYTYIHTSWINEQLNIDVNVSLLH